MQEKEGKTVQEAFEELISQRAWYKEVGLTKTAANTMISRYRSGDNLSLEKIRAVLSKAGLNIIQEELWR